jgi:hypothetical protein
MRTSAIARVLSVGGLSVAGLVGGHALGYALAVPDAHHRSMLIAETGHGYLPSASWAAVVLGLAAVVAGVVSGYVRRSRSVDPRFGTVSMRLVPAQVWAFVALEVLERLASGASLGSFSPRLAVVGVLTQIVVSLVVAMLLAGLRRVGSALAGAERAVVLSVVRRRFPEFDLVLRGLERGWSERVRAPPAARPA